MKKSFTILSFDNSLKTCGGFNHTLGKIFNFLFRTYFCYMYVDISTKFKLKYSHNDDNYYYDGYHNLLCIGFIHISYGT